MSTTMMPPSPTDNAPDESGDGSDHTVDHQPGPKHWPWLELSPVKLAFGFVAGMVFGFLLQKGGVAKFDILQGVLLLENFVVVKVMLAAIIVGMVGSYLLRRAGVIELQIGETRYAANTIGGLIFGAGFALLAYCPGTNAAAIGQGNLDALVGMTGLVVGSYLFAWSSRYGTGKLKKWGHRGKITLADLLGLSQGLLVLIAAPLLIAVLFALESAGW